MQRKNKGFTLIEVIITLVIVGILTAIAVPNYKRYVVRASRESAQGELLRLASLQEKIYLNSNAFSSSITANYTAQAVGGLGVTGGKTSDGKYTLTINPATGTPQDFIITATSVAGKSQAGDGDITINAAGVRMWGSTPW